MRPISLYEGELSLLKQLREMKTFYCFIQIRSNVKTNKDR